MCRVRGVLSVRFGQSEGRMGGREEADAFVFSVSANENKYIKSEMAVDSTRRLS